MHASQIKHENITLLEYYNTDEIFHRYLNINSIKKNINEIMNKKFLSENILSLFYMLLVIL